MNERDVFHATELFLLSSAFEANQLFGLPDKQTYQLLGEHVCISQLKSEPFRNLILSHLNLNKNSSILQFLSF